MEMKFDNSRVDSVEKNKVIRAWAFYDWANSSFPLVISSSIFPIYYTQITGGDSNRVSFLGYDLLNTELVSYVSAFAFLIISIMSPLLSGIADYTGRKKRFLKFFCFLGGFSTIALTLFGDITLEAGMFIFILAMIGFWNSLVFYNAYLPEIAPPEEHDRISAKGFSMGYIGASILLITCLGLYMSDSMPVQYSFALTGIWWIGFSFMTYPKLPPPRLGRATNSKGVIWNGYRELGKVWKEMKATVRLKRYLFAFFIFSMGIQTIMIMASYFGAKEISWANDEHKTTGLIVSILIIQFIAVGGAYLCARLSEKIGNIRALSIIILTWVMICISALWVYTPVQFYSIAAAVGLVMGGVQSLSRSTYAKFIPVTKDTSSYFSFYDVSEKIGIAIGTLSYGVIEGMTGSMRESIVALIIFFVVGFLLLLRVPKEETEFKRQTV